jgi:hypothetical protein
MPRMPSVRTRTFVMMVVVASAAVEVSATKCANSFVFVEGRFEDSMFTDATIQVETEPDSLIKQKPIAIGKDGTFEAKLLFATSNSVQRGDCSRRPTAVIVTVRRRGQVVRSLRLEIERDFAPEGWAPNFRVRQPIRLRGSE